MFRAILRLNASGSPNAVSNGSTLTASAPPTPAAKAATVVRSMFTQGSYLAIIGRDVTACCRWPRHSGDASQSSPTRSHSRRAALSLAIVRNWSSVAAYRNSISPRASSIPNPASVRIRRYAEPTAML